MSNEDVISLIRSCEYDFGYFRSIIKNEVDTNEDNYESIIILIVIFECFSLRVEKSSSLGS